MYVLTYIYVVVVEVPRLGAFFIKLLLAFCFIIKKEISLTFEVPKGAKSVYLNLVKTFSFCLLVRLFKSGTSNVGLIGLMNAVVGLGINTDAVPEFQYQYYFEKFQIKNIFEKIKRFLYRTPFVCYNRGQTSQMFNII